MKRPCPENYRFDSDKNQAIKGMFVGREVNECQTGFIEACLQKGILNYEDIKNTEEYSDQDKYDRLQKLMKALDVGMEKYLSQSREGLLLLGKKELLQDQIDNLETKSKKIFEWYSVTEWLAKKLEEHGEPIVSYDEFNWWWGRTCSGQAILLDGVISEICWGMGILEGQENEWKV